MMATSFIVDPLSGFDRLKRERDDLVAVLVGSERHHGQLDLLAELQSRRIVLGESALDANHCVLAQAELDQADAERDEVRTGRALVRSAGRETLGGPCDEGAAPRQEHLRHLAGTALGAALLDGKCGGSALGAGAADELWVLVGPGRDLGGERYLLCRHAVDDIWK